MADQPYHRFSLPVAAQRKTEMPARSQGRGQMRLLLAVGLLSTMLLLGACGIFGSAENTAPQGDATTQTQTIARDFSADGDLEKARAAVNALDVANPGQWLIFVTENAVIDAARDPGLAQSLVQLTLGLGYEEATISDFAVANGLADDTASVAGSQAAADAATVAAAMAAPVAAAPVAAAPIDAAPVAAAPVGAAAGTAPATGLAAEAKTLLAEAPAAAAPAAEAAQPAAEAAAARRCALGHGHRTGEPARRARC